MKHTAVVFTHNNARVIFVDDVSKIQAYDNVVWNADLSYVKGIPPHFWKMENGFILPMNDKEAQNRIDNIVQSGTTNDVHSKQLQELEEKRQKEEEASKKEAQSIFNDMLKEKEEFNADYRLLKEEVNDLSLGFLSLDKSIHQWRLITFSLWVLSFILIVVLRSRH